MRKLVKTGFVFHLQSSAVVWLPRHAANCAAVNFYWIWNSNYSRLMTKRCARLCRSAIKWLLILFIEDTNSMFALIMLRFICKQSRSWALSVVQRALTTYYTRVVWDYVIRPRRRSIVFLIDWLIKSFKNIEMQYQYHSTLHINATHIYCKPTTDPYYRIFIISWRGTLSHQTFGFHQHCRLDENNRKSENYWHPSSELCLVWLHSQGIVNRNGWTVNGMNGHHSN